MIIDLDRYIVAKRPRCKRCGSPALRTYKSLPRDGDVILRYVRCTSCGTSQILLLE